MQVLEEKKDEHDLIELKKPNSYQLELPTFHKKQKSVSFNSTNLTSHKISFNYSKDDFSSSQKVIKNSPISDEISYDIESISNSYSRAKSVDKREMDSSLDGTSFSTGINTSFNKSSRSQSSDSISSSSIRINRELYRDIMGSTKEYNKFPNAL